MANAALTFEQLPEVVSELRDKVDFIERFLIERYNEPQPDSDKWLDIDQLIDYLPNKPAKSTIYGKVHLRHIPFHKQGKALIFRKSEIDAWLTLGRVKTVDEIESEAANYLRRKG